MNEKINIIFREKPNKRGGPDKKIGNYKLYKKYIKMRERGSYTPGNK